MDVAGGCRRRECRVARRRRFVPGSIFSFANRRCVDRRSLGAARSYGDRQTLASSVTGRGDIGGMDRGLTVGPNQVERFGIPSKKWASDAYR
jgi:hypothetical protein